MCVQRHAGCWALQDRRGALGVRGLRVERFVHVRTGRSPRDWEKKEGEGAGGGRVVRSFARQPVAVHINRR